MAPLEPQDDLTVVPNPTAPDAEAVPLKPLTTNPKDAHDTGPFLVVFDPHYDASNPLDWPAGRKWMVTDVLSATGFNRIMVSTVMAPALPAISAELGMSPTEAAMSLSIYLLATAFGPLVLGPLSEVYGRSVVLHGSSVWFLIWNIVCGFAETKGTLIAARFLAGFGASAIYSLAGGVLGDIWRPEQRGKSLGMYLLIPLLGAAVGPILGGIIAARTTWRWIFWSTSAFQLAMILITLISFHETSASLILRRRAARLRKETGDARYHALEDGKTADKKHSPARVILRALSRPIRFLLFHPITQVSALLSGFNYGILYIVLSTFSGLWTSRYGESVEVSGVHYLACALGEMAGSQVGGPALDYFYGKRSADKKTPEARLPLAYPAIIISWAGMLAYGWTAEYGVAWYVVDMAVFVLMFGMQLGEMPMTAYVIDVYKEHTSSAMAAQQFVRSLTAFAFPLFAPSVYAALGYGWTNTILAAASVLISVPLPLFLWKYGARLREKARSTY